MLHPPGRGHSARPSRIRVAGIVQGVGFRPFVHALAAGFGLAGFVGNDETGVLIEAEGSARGVVGVRGRAARPAARAGRGDRVDVAARRRRGRGLRDRAEHGARPADHPVSPDTATCEDCLRELSTRPTAAPLPVHQLHDCGPRFTIIRVVPTTAR